MTGGRRSGPRRLYRPDFRAEVEASEIGGFTVNQAFLMTTTIYVVMGGRPRG